MRLKQIDETITEAARFIEQAKIAREAFKSSKYAGFGCLETGACRRASMDLTRSLARLRKP